MNIIGDHCLTQVVNIPTRNDKTLDLLFTKAPSPVNRVLKGMPPVGKAIHDIVYVEYDINEISSILALIYNESLAQGDVPDGWRQTNVSLVFKKGEIYDAANYRLVSLTCICCKTLEHILVSDINKHLALDSILADCQHGFRSQRSCQTKLVQFVHDIISNLDWAVNRGHRQI